MNKLFDCWPIVTSENCFGVIRDLGIKKWPLVNEMPIAEYLASATEEQKKDYLRFGPKIFAAIHTQPSGKSFEGFLVRLKPASLVFALVADESGKQYVLTTAEYKHGNDRITIVPVAGVPSKAEKDLPLPEMMAQVALREFREETGIELVSVKSLGPAAGTFSTVRNVDVAMFPFVGEVKMPIVKGETKLDKNEQIAMVAFPLNEWMKLIETPELWDQNPDFGLETYTIEVTYLALHHLGYLSFTK